MDLNGFSRWFRNFSVENGFGKFEGVRTYHYVRETVDGETILSVMGIKSGSN